MAQHKSKNSRASRGLIFPRPRTIDILSRGEGGRQGLEGGSRANDGALAGSAPPRFAGSVRGWGGMLPVKLAPGNWGGEQMLRRRSGAMRGRRPGDEPAAGLEGPQVPSRRSCPPKAFWSTCLVGAQCRPIPLVTRRHAPRSRAAGESRMEESPQTRSTVPCRSRRLLPGAWATEAREAPCPFGRMDVRTCVSLPLERADEISYQERPKIKRK